MTSALGPQGHTGWFCLFSVNGMSLARASLLCGVSASPCPEFRSHGILGASTASILRDALVGVLSASFAVYVQELKLLDSVLSWC